MWYLAERPVIDRRMRLPLEQCQTVGSKGRRIATDRTVPLDQREVDMDGTILAVGCQPHGEHGMSRQRPRLFERS